MSALSTLTRRPTDDSDLSIDFDGDAGPPLPPTERTSEALARCLLDAAMTSRHRRLLKTRPRLVVIHTPNEAISDLLDTYLSNLDRSRMVEAFSERQRVSGKLEARGREQLSRLEHGRSVILISHDPEGVLVPEAIAGADATIAVPPPDLAVIRKTIRAVTGKVARGLVPADIEQLSIGDLLTAIRPGLSARQCVANLRRAARYQLKNTQEGSGTPLERLALTSPVASWAYETLTIMRQVTEGSLKPTALRFTCLEGPPGTGKTTLAEAISVSADWAFISTSVGSWFANSGGHLGDVIRAARKFFDDIAVSQKPVVALLDEIDAIPDRATMDKEALSWWVPVVTYLLTEIDRLRKAGRPVLLIGATNHYDRLDGALIRPGRLEKRISALLPDLADRHRLFASCLGDRIGHDGLDTLARLAVMATPAQVESWCQSAIATAESEQRSLALRDLVDLIAPPDGRTPEQDRAVAIHEAGHAIVAIELGLPVAEVSILSLGAIGGWVKSALDRHSLVTRTEIERHGTMMLGGRAADSILGGGAHAGAAADIDAVNALIKTAMLELGLYGSLSTAATSDFRTWHDGVSLWTAISAELTRLYERAARIVDRRRDDIFALVDVLLVERVVTGDRLSEILTPVSPVKVADGPIELAGEDDHPGRPA